MALNRDKLKNIVGGITTPPPSEPPAAKAALEPVAPPPEPRPPTAGQGHAAAADNGSASEAKDVGQRRFAQRGRPKGRKEAAADGKIRKVKVSLYLSEAIVNDLYDWAHADRMHPGEMFDLALRQFHEKEAKRRNA